MLAFALEPIWHYKEKEEIRHHPPRSLSEALSRGPCLRHNLRLFGKRRVVKTDCLL